MPLKRCNRCIALKRYSDHNEIRDHSSRLLSTLVLESVAIYSRMFHRLWKTFVYLGETWRGDYLLSTERRSIIVITSLAVNYGPSRLLEKFQGVNTRPPSSPSFSLIPGRRGCYQRDLYSRTAQIFEADWHGICFYRRTANNAIKKWLRNNCENEI